MSEPDFEDKELLRFCNHIWHDSSLFFLCRTSHAPWTIKTKYHAQAELLTTIWNDIIATGVTVAITHGVMLASSCATVLVKMDTDMGFPPLGWIPGISFLGIGAVLVGFLFLRFAEQFREESIGFQAELEADVTAYFKRKTNIRGFNRLQSSRPMGRSFRRRPLGIRFGSFMYIDPGMCVSYIAQIVDNTVNLVFTVDLWSDPITLL